MTLKVIIIYVILYLVCAIFNYIALHIYYNNKKFCESEKPDRDVVNAVICPINVIYTIAIIYNSIDYFISSWINSIDYNKFLRVSNKNVDDTGENVK